MALNPDDTERGVEMMDSPTTSSELYKLECEQLDHPIKLHRDNRGTWARMVCNPVDISAHEHPDSLPPTRMPIHQEQYHAIEFRGISGESSWLWVSKDLCGKASLIAGIINTETRHLLGANAILREENARLKYELADLERAR